MPTNVFEDMEVYLNEKQAWFDDNQNEPKEVFEKTQEEIETKCKEMIGKMSEQNFEAPSGVNMDDLKANMQQASPESEEEDGPAIEEID